jgi:hypothetical protein
MNGKICEVTGVKAGIASHLICVFVGIDVTDNLLEDFALDLES